MKILNDKGHRLCTECEQPVLLAYMPGNPEPVDILHLTGPQGHDADTDISDILDRIYGQPPEGFFE